MALQGGTALLVAVAASSGIPVPTHGQDIEVSAQVTRRALPTAYYDRVRQQSDFFEISRGWRARAFGKQEGAPVAGTLAIVIVPALFADSPTPSAPADEIQRVLFDGPSEPGTLVEFYAAVSGGQLQIEGHTLPWVRTDLTVPEVRGSSFGLGADARTGEWLMQALAAADQATDFGEFDSDGPDGIPNSGDDDGVVDALAIEFLEAAVTCAGGGPTIWAHRSRISNWTELPFTTNDPGANGNPIVADDYIVQAAERCDGRLQRVTTMAHELGHILGLPDLYDRTEGILPEQRSWVVGCWTLMAAGTWGCGEALAEGRWDRPTHIGPWEKNVLGWLPNLRVVGDVQHEEFTLQPVEETGQALLIPLTPSEYLLVEYREQIGFDVNLPAAGVLIYHVDEDRAFRRCRSCKQIYHVALVEADGNGSLIQPEGQGGNRGEAGDVFAATRPVRFTNATFPSTRLNSGAASNVSFYRIAVEDGIARLTISTTTIALDRLVQSFVDGAAELLTAEEETYLDTVGNGNGRYDVGDLRRYLRSHPSVTAGATQP